MKPDKGLTELSVQKVTAIYRGLVHPLEIVSVLRAQHRQDNLLLVLSSASLFVLKQAHSQYHADPLPNVTDGCMSTKRKGI